MKKLWMLLDLFRKGNELVNAEKWKAGGNATTLLVPIILLLVKLAGDFGYGFEITTEQATNIALGIVAIVQFIVHNITSKRAGILPAKEPAEPVVESNKPIAQDVPAEESAPVQRSTQAKDPNTDIYFG